MMSEPAGNVLPVYFVADESGSMAGDIDQLNLGLVNLLDALHAESMAAAKVRFCVIGFADDAICYLEPSDLRDVEQMPRLDARGTTSYASVLRELHERIPRDVERLKADGYLVNRPAVFFLTDGVPNAGDGWREIYASLTDASFRARPNILAFGMGHADPDVVRHLATSEEYAFVTAAGVDTGKAIVSFVTALTQSVISSGHALASGDAELPVEKPEGFISLSVDTV